MMGWPKTVQALISAQELLPALIAQEEAERKAYSEPTGNGHLAPRDCGAVRPESVASDPVDNVVKPSCLGRRKGHKRHHATHPKAPVGAWITPQPLRLLAFCR